MKLPAVSFQLSTGADKESIHETENIHPDWKETAKGKE